MGCREICGRSFIFAGSLGEFQNNFGAVPAIGTARAHSGSSFSARFTRRPTGYFFFN